MSAVIRSNVHPGVLTSTGGGGVGTSVGPAQFARVALLAACPSIDVIALHSDAPPAEVDALLAGYADAIGSATSAATRPAPLAASGGGAAPSASAAGGDGTAGGGTGGGGGGGGGGNRSTLPPRPTRLLLQDWGVAGGRPNSTALAEAMAATAAVAARHGVPQLYRALQVQGGSGEGGGRQKIDDR
jgi:hypothetical protein